MDRATQLWIGWQSLLSAFARSFTRLGCLRFVLGGTGIVLGWEEHPIKQLLRAMGLGLRRRYGRHRTECSQFLISLEEPENTLNLLARGENSQARLLKILEATA